MNLVRIIKKTIEVQNVIGEEISSIVENVRNQKIKEKVLQAQNTNNVIVYIKGWTQGKGALTPLKKLGKLYGIKSVEIDYNCKKSIQEIADTCMERLVMLHEMDYNLYGYGHSLGGLIFREIIENKGGKELLKKCALIAAPNQGTNLAKLAHIPFIDKIPLIKKLSPKSIKQLSTERDYIKQVLNREVPENFYFNAIAKYDELILPPKLSYLSGATNKEYDLAHISILYSEQVFTDVLKYFDLFHSLLTKNT